MDEKPGYMLIRTKSIAVKKPYIQVNPPLMTIYFIFDDDKEDSALSWFDAGLPKPFGQHRILLTAIVTIATN